MILLAVVGYTIAILFVCLAVAVVVANVVTYVHDRVDTALANFIVRVSQR